MGAPRGYPRLPQEFEDVIAAPAINTDYDRLVDMRGFYPVTFFGYSTGQSVTMTVHHREYQVATYFPVNGLSIAIGAFKKDVWNIITAEGYIFSDVMLRIHTGPVAPTRIVIMIKGNRL